MWLGEGMGRTKAPVAEAQRSNASQFERRSRDDRGVEVGRSGLA